jgi:hypothetical protein
LERKGLQKTTTITKNNKFSLVGSKTMHIVLAFFLEEGPVEKNVE